MSFLTKHFCQFHHFLASCFLCCAVTQIEEKEEGNASKQWANWVTVVDVWSKVILIMSTLMSLSMNRRYCQLHTTLFPFSDQFHLWALKPHSQPDKCGKIKWFILTWYIHYIWPTSASGFVLCLSFRCCQAHFGSSSFCLSLPLFFMFPFMKLLNRIASTVLSFSRFDGFHCWTLREHMVQGMSAVEQTDQLTMQTILLWAN